MAKLESLIVDMQVNTAKLQKGLDAANAKLDGFNKKINAMAGLVGFEKIGGAALKAGAAMAEFVAKGIESLDRLGKQAELFGETPEAFSRLAYAFRQGGVEGDAFGKALLGLGKHLSEAASGTKEQVALFRALGVSATDSKGAVRKESEVLADLADKFKNLKDGPAKAQLAIALFGQGGEKMVETLSKGSAGLRELAADSDKYGSTVSSGAAAAAAAFNDTLAKAASLMDAVGQRLAAEVLPKLNLLFDKVTKSNAITKIFATTVDVLADSLRGAAIVSVVVVGALDALLETIGHVAKAMVFMGLSMWGPAIREGEKAKGSFEKLKRDMAASLGEALKPPKLDAPEGPKGGKDAAATLRAQKAIEAALTAQEKAAKESAQALKELDKVADEYERKVSTFGDTDPLADLEARLENGDLADKLAKLGDNAEAMKDRILEAADALRRLETEKFQRDLTVDVAFKKAAVREEGSRQAATFSRTGFALWEQQTQGFTDIVAALSAWEAAQVAAIDAAAGLAEATRSGNEGAQVEYRQAAVAAEGAARAASDAMDAFRQHADAQTASSEARNAAIQDAAGAKSWGEAIEKLEKNFEKSMGKMPDFGAQLSLWFERMSGMLGAAGQKMLGAVGDLVGSIVEGAKSGGVWGAIIAAFMEIAQKTASALAFLDVAMEFIEQIAALVEPLVAPIFDALTGVLAVVLDVVAPVFEALQPLFTAIGKLVENLAPILYAIGDLVEALSPIIEFLGKAIGSILEVFKPVFEIIGGVIKFVATIVLGIVIMMNELAAVFGDEKAKAEALRLRGLIVSMWQRTPEEDLEAQRRAKEELERLAREGKKSADALASFSSALTNTPTGFRYAAAAFNAQGYGDERVFDQPESPPLDITLLLDGEVLAQILERGERRKGFRKQGYSTVGNTR